MNEQEFLTKFQKILKDEEYDCALVQASDAIPYAKLLVFLGLDEKDRERILEVTALKQELMKGQDSTEDAEPDIFRIQFQASFSFSVQPSAVQQVSSFICYLNSLIELPGFEMNEINLKLFYRYVWMYWGKKINKKLCLSIVGLIMLFMELFGSSLEKVAAGETTF